MKNNNELFDGLDGKVDFLNDKKAESKGLYKAALKLAKDKKKGYRSVIRFLPNFKKDGTIGQSAIEKITHYIDLPDPFRGYYDSPTNFKEKDNLGKLFWEMKKSSNAILQENSKKIQYSKKYYSYVLILEDENQPELVGKIMVFQYGKTIKDKIAAEKSGEVSGVSTNIFNLQNGKDFVLLVKQINTGEETYPDYKMSAFKPKSSPLQIFKDGTFKPVPIKDGLIDENAQDMVKAFLLNREHDLEEFEPKRLDETQLNKINEICNILTNKAKVNNNPTASDFVEEITTTIAEDDFFAN